MLTLVLLPGMDGTSALFAPLIKALGAKLKIQCVVYPNDQVLSYVELTRYVRAQLPCDTPYVLLGESFSGPIAIMLAAEHALDSNSHSNRMLGLGLCCTFARNPQPTMAKLSRWIQTIVTLKPPTALLSYLLLGRMSTPELRSLLKQAVAQLTRQVMRGRLEAVSSIDVSHNLAAIKLPVLSLSARQDRLVPMAASQLICDLNPLVQWVQMDAPHCLLQTQPISAAAQVLAFCIRLKSAT